MVLCDGCKKTGGQVKPKEYAEGGDEPRAGVRDAVSLGAWDERCDCHVEGGDKEKFRRVLKRVCKRAREKNESGDDDCCDEEEEDQVEYENHCTNSIKAVKLIGCFMEHESDAAG